MVWIKQVSTKVVNGKYYLPIHVGNRAPQSSRTGVVCFLLCGDEFLDKANVRQAQELQMQA